MSINRFFVMIKPDGVKRCLVGTIISRFEERGFTLQRIELRSPDIDIVKAHYDEHRTQSFFNDLVKFTLSGFVVPMVWDVNIQVARNIVGSTVPLDASSNTIRGKYACNIPENLVHCSDSIENANREIDLWFGKDAV